MPAAQATDMDATTLTQALALADAAGGVREAAAALRSALAPLRVVVVDAFDMRGEAPAASSTRCHLYLGANDGHCWTVTQDWARAAGLFITERA